MLLIFGDMVKAMSLFLLAIVSIEHGAIKTESAFCQSSGFFLQFGTETSGWCHWSCLYISLMSSF